MVEVKYNIAVYIMLRKVKLCGCREGGMKNCIYYKKINVLSSFCPRLILIFPPTIFNSISWSYPFHLKT